MNKDIVKNAIICLKNMKIEDTTYQIAKDIVLDEYEELEDRINKAIEYIEENCSEHGNPDSMWFYRTINADNVINILKGE